MLRVASGKVVFPDEMQCFPSMPKFYGLDEGKKIHYYTKIRTSTTVLYG